MTGDSIARSARGVYGISVTSELSGVAQQTLRLYERRGLLTPARTDGGTRRYSDDDLERLGRITELVGQGVNLAGIAQILALETKNSQLQSDYTKLELLNAKLKFQRNNGVNPSRQTSDRKEGCDHDGRREPGSRRRNT
ncbi:MAG: MerR family transcriptional regulator [Mycobacterium sp.]|nr:MerR family transcriptional regulator [Mycobacterium sp.]